MCACMFLCHFQTSCKFSSNKEIQKQDTPCHSCQARRPHPSCRAVCICIVSHPHMLRKYNLNKEKLFARLCACAFLGHLQMSCKHSWNKQKQKQDTPCPSCHARRLFARSCTTSSVSVLSMHFACWCVRYVGEFWCERTSGTKVCLLECSAEKHLFWQTGRNIRGCAAFLSQCAWADFVKRHQYAATYLCRAFRPRPSRPSHQEGPGREHRERLHFREVPARNQKQTTNEEYVRQCVAGWRKMMCMRM
jgi:hypothetical protein